MRALTPSMVAAMLVLESRMGQPTYLSNKNGSSYIASGSAAALEDRGLLEFTSYVMVRKVRLTDAGIAWLVEYRQEHPVEEGPGE